MLELDPRVEQVTELQKSESYDEALALVEGWLAQEPDDPALLFCRGSLRLSREDVPGAIADWERALDGRMALAARLQELYPALVEKSFYNFHFETTVDNDSITHGALGRAYRLFGRFDEAVRHLGIALDLNPAAWSEGCLMATLLARTGQVEPALQVLTRMLETRPDNVEILYHMGLHYFQQNSMAFALRHLEKANRLEPTDLRVRQVLGEIYLKQGRFDLGEPQFLECIQRGPSASAYLGMAECVKGQYRFDEALQYLRSAVDLEPRNLRALLELGNLALQFGDLELGVDCLKRALEQEPNQPEVYALLAKAAQQRGDADGAIDSYRKWLELSPNEGVPNHALGNLLRTRGSYAEARHHLEKAHELMGKDVLVTLDLADCLARLDDRASALSLLKATLEAHPHHSELRAALLELDPSAVPVDRTLTSSLIQTQEEHNPWLDPEPAAAEEPVAVAAESAPPEALPPAPAEPVAEPSNFEEALERARHLAATGQEADALKAYRKALVFDSSQRECRIEAARLHAKKGLYELGSDFLVDAFRQDPTDASLWPELIDWLSRVDEMDREESLSKLVLGIPADLERPPLFSLLYGLRRGVDRETLVDLIAQGLMSRFPSDAEARQRWEDLKSGAVEPTYLEPPEPPEPVVDVVYDSDELPELEFVSPPPVEEQPATVDELPTVEDVPLGPTDFEPEESAPAEAPQDEPMELEESAPPEATPPSPEELMELEESAPVEAPQEEPMEFVPMLEAEPAEAPADPVALEPEVAELTGSEMAEQLTQVLAQEPPLREVGMETFPGPKGQGETPWEILGRAADALAAAGWYRQSALLWLQMPEEHRDRGRCSLSLHHWRSFIELGSAEQLTAFDQALAREFGELQPLPPTEAVPQAESEALPVDEGVVEAAPEPEAAPEEAPAQEESAPQAASEALPVDEGVVGVAPEPEPAPEEAPAQEEAAPQAESEALPADEGVVEAAPESEPAPEAAPAWEEAAPGADSAALTLDEAFEALKASPDDDVVLARVFELGVGQEEVILNYFRALSRDQPDEPLHCRNFARAYVRLNKPILAVVQYQKYLVARPNPAGYRELAETYAMLKRDKNVAEALKKAEELESAAT